MSGPAEELQQHVVHAQRGNQACTLEDSKAGECFLRTALARATIQINQTRRAAGTQAADAAAHLTFSRRITASMPFTSGSTTRASWRCGVGGVGEFEARGG